MSSLSQHKPGNKTSPLLKLPAELRNHIYQILLVAPYPIQLGVEDDNGRRATVRIQNWYDASPSANILATCKQINREASAHLYGDNTFTLQQDIRALSAFLARIKKSALLVRRVNIVYSYPKTFGTLALKALQHAPNLTELQIAYSPKFGYDVNVMADLLLPWVRAHDVDSLDKLGGLKFYLRLGYMGLNPKMFDPTAADTVVDTYAREVKARLLRLLKVKKG